MLQILPQLSCQLCAHSATRTPHPCFEFAQPLASSLQTRELLKRNLQQYQRLWSYNGTRAGFTLLIAILFGTVLKAGGDNFHNYNGLLNIVGVQYSATMFIGILNVSAGV